MVMRIRAQQDANGKWEIIEPKYRPRYAGEWLCQTCGAKFVNEFPHYPPRCPYQDADHPKPTTITRVYAAD